MFWTSKPDFRRWEFSYSSAYDYLYSEPYLFFQSISTRVSPVNDIWSPAPADDIMSQMSSITLSAERHLGLPVVDAASTSTSSGDIWRHDSLTSRGLITN